MNVWTIPEVRQAVQRILHAAQLVRFEQPDLPPRRQLQEARRYCPGEILQATMAIVRAEEMRRPRHRWLVNAAYSARGPVTGDKPSISTRAGICFAKSAATGLKCSAKHRYSSSNAFVLQPSPAAAAQRSASSTAIFRHSNRICLAAVRAAVLPEGVFLRFLFVSYDFNHEFNPLKTLLRQGI
jgi:phage baseplate assembly protein W